VGKIAVLAGNHDVGLYCASTLIDTYGDNVPFAVALGLDGTLRKAMMRWGTKHIPYEGEDQIVELIQEHNITTVVLAWWPFIVHKINKIGINVINTHPSYLPYNRGKHPYYWSIVDGTPFGVTIHRVDDGIDTGSILWRQEIPVLPTDTGESLYKTACVQMKLLFRKHLDDIGSEKFPVAIKQSEKKATGYHSRDFVIEPIDPNGLYEAGALIDDLRARTFDNAGSGRQIEIDGKMYRIHLRLVEGL